MTNRTAAQAAHRHSVLTREEVGELYKDWFCIFGVNAGSAELCIREIEAAVLSKLRAPVAGERTADTLTQVYDRFGIGVLARNPSTLMVCLGNVIRRANCLSQVELVLSVPTTPEPDDDGIWGEESLLRWGADEKGYAEHFKAALAEWSRHAALASAPVAGEPVRKPVMSVAEFCAEADRLGLTADTLFAQLAQRPEFADCLPQADKDGGQQRAEVTEAQCVAVYQALDEFGSGIDIYDFGLPGLNDHRRQKVVEIIRAALSATQTEQGER